MEPPEERSAKDGCRPTVVKAGIGTVAAEAEDIVVEKAVVIRAVMLAAVSASKAAIEVEAAAVVCCSLVDVLVVRSTVTVVCVLFFEYVCVWEAV